MFEVSYRSGSPRADRLSLLFRAIASDVAELFRPFNRSSFAPLSFFISQACHQKPGFGRSASELLSRNEAPSAIAPRLAECCHDTASTMARSVDDVARIQDTLSRY